MTESKHYDFLDGLKLLSCLIILIHHWSNYVFFTTPHPNTFLDPIFILFANYGRYIIAIFFCISGFLFSNKYFQNAIIPNINLRQNLFKTYIHFVIPYCAAILLSITCMTFANLIDPTFQYSEIPVTAKQLALNIAMLQSFFQVPSLSAGLWYIPIHLQLLFLSLWILKIINKYIQNNQLSMKITGIIFSILWLASIFYFNLIPNDDCWGIYFFGMFGCGVLTGYSFHFQPKLMIAINLIATIALIMNFKIRLLISLITADSIFLYLTRPSLNKYLNHFPLSFKTLAHFTFSIFLIHYPIIVLLNSIFKHFQANNIPMLMFNFVCTIILTLVLAKPFYNWFEKH
jgi:peptidoglycan/LPS O-acetylase OafA/YrhL